MDFLTELWKAAQQAGPFAVLIMLYAYLDARKELKESQSKYDQIVNEFIRLASDANATQKDWQNIFGKIKSQ